MYKTITTPKELQAHFKKLYSEKYGIENIDIQIFKNHIRVPISCLRGKPLKLEFPYKKLTEDNSYSIEVEEYNDNKIFYNKYPLIVDEVLSENIKNN